MTLRCIGPRDHGIVASGVSRSNERGPATILSHRRVQWHARLGTRRARWPEGAGPRLFLVSITTPSRNKKRETLPMSGILERRQFCRRSVPGDIGPGAQWPQAPGRCPAPGGAPGPAAARRPSQVAGRPPVAVPESGAPLHPAMRPLALFTTCQRGSRYGSPLAGLSRGAGTYLRRCVGSRRAGCCT